MTQKQTASIAEDELVLTPNAPDADQGEDTADCEDPDETVEVEYEGHTYQVPRPLKGALMRQADYTRKTQELAQQRKVVEAAQQSQAARGPVEALALARLHMLDGQLAPFTQLNWGALAAQDPVRAQILARQVGGLRQARFQAGQIFKTLQQKRNLDTQRGRARQIEDGRARLQKDVEDWSPDLQRRLIAAGRANEFSDAEIHSVTDPRMIKVLNKARLFDEHQTKEATAKRLTAAQAAKPATEVGAKSPASRDPARMTTAEWMRWRAGQLRKRN